MSVRVYKALAILLLCGLTGCAHRKTLIAPAPQPQPPELNATPLYSPEMSENNPRTPALPTEAVKEVVKEPEPPPKKTRKLHTPKPKSPPPPKLSGGDADVAAAPPSSVSPPAPAAPAPPASVPVAEKKQQETQQAKANAAGPSPIGELTTGDSAEVAATSSKTFELIRTTRDGAEAIKRRALSTEEKKTVVEIGTFLTRAHQPLRNGDVDGAYGLATKAKILLDELTQN